MHNLTVQLLTPHPLRDPGAPRRLFTLLQRHAAAAVPTRWDRTEPLEHDWDLNAAIADWTWPGLLFASGEAAEGSIYQPYLPRYPHGTMVLRADPAMVDPGAAAAFARAAAAEFRADYAHVHLITPRDLGVPTAPRSITWDDHPYLFVTWHELRQWLPELWWATVLGRPYVELLGRERIAAAPAPTVEEIADGTWWLQLTPDPRDLERDWDEFARVRSAVKAHLDPNGEIFWEPRRSTYRTPRFPTADAPGSS